MKRSVEQAIRDLASVRGLVTYVLPVLILLAWLLARILAEISGG